MNPTVTTGIFEHPPFNAPHLVMLMCDVSLYGFHLKAFSPKIKLQRFNIIALRQLFL